MVTSKIGAGAVNVRVYSLEDIPDQNVLQEEYTVKQEVQTIAYNKI